MKKNFKILTVPCFSGAVVLTALLAGMTTKKAAVFSKAKFMTDSSDIMMVKNANGPTLRYSSISSVKILTVDGKKFKDLNKNGKLDKYEDWRLPVDERAKD